MKLKCLNHIFNFFDLNRTQKKNNQNLFFKQINENQNVIICIDCQALIFMAKPIHFLFVLVSMLTCYHCFQIKTQPNAILNILPEISLSDDVDCIPDCPSDYGSPSKCSITLDPTGSISVKTTVMITKGTFWNGDQDWDFYIVDKDYHTYGFDETKCVKSQPAKGSKSRGYLMPLSFSCPSLPKKLQSKDYLQIAVFNTHPDISDHLFYKIPIPGYSSGQMIQTQPEKIKSKEIKQAIVNEQEA